MSGPTAKTSPTQHLTLIALAVVGIAEAVYGVHLQRSGNDFGAGLTFAAAIFCGISFFVCILIASRRESGTIRDTSEALGDATAEALGDATAWLADFFMSIAGDKDALDQDEIDILEARRLAAELGVEEEAVLALCRIFAAVGNAEVAAMIAGWPKPPDAWVVPKTFPRSVARRRAVIARHGCAAALR